MLGSTVSEEPCIPSDRSKVRSSFGTAACAFSRDSLLLLRDPSHCSGGEKRRREFEGCSAPRVAPSIPSYFTLDWDQSYKHADNTGGLVSPGRSPLSTRVLFLFRARD